MLYEVFIGRALAQAAAMTRITFHAHPTASEVAAFERSLDRPSVFERRACAKL